jgi:hypothetical protein
MDRRIIIGSTAAKHWFVDYREPYGTDYISPTESGCIEWVDAFQWIFDKVDGDIAPPEILYTIKLSHCFWPVHWSKTMWDIEFFQRKQVQYIEELFNVLYRSWESRFGVKHKVILDKDKDKYFNNGARRTYCHNDIHRAVAYYDKPLVEEIKHRSNNTLISKPMFNNLPKSKQIKLCREEIYTTAIEHFVVPRNFAIKPEYAYTLACKLLLTTKPRGWLTKFIALNWAELSSSDEWPYIELFKSALAHNEVTTV